MTVPEVTIRCPHCMGQRVQPYGAAWRCLDCGKVFEQAGVSIEEPEPRKEKPE